MFEKVVEAGGGDSSSKRIVHVATAGTLPNLIPESIKYTVKELILTGELNGTDFRLLRDMAGNNYLGEETAGKLTILDMTNAKVIAGGEKYLDTNTITCKGNAAVYHGSCHYEVTDNNAIPKFVFSGCNLKVLQLPNSVTSIGSHAFWFCSDLTSITIPNSVTSIGNDAFSHCSGLTSITIPQSVTSIGSSAFDGCSGLTSVTIPNSVTSIGDYAFYHCSGLTSVTIGNSVSNIGSGAFYICSKLTNVYCYAEQVPNITSRPDPFVYATIVNATLHVPAVSIDAYKTAETWKEFGSIVALTDEDPSPTGITNVNQDNTTGRQYYFLDGKRSTTPQRGLNIVKMSDGSTRKVVVK